MHRRRIATPEAIAQDDNRALSRWQITSLRKERPDSLADHRADARHVIANVTKTLVIQRAVPAAHDPRELLGMRHRQIGE